MFEIFYVRVMWDVVGVKFNKGKEWEKCQYYSGSKVGVLDFGAWRTYNMPTVLCWYNPSTISSYQGKGIYLGPTGKC